MESKSIEFVYNYKNYDGSEKSISHFIDIPFYDDYVELSNQIVSKMDDMMKYLDASEDLKPKLLLFIKNANQDYLDECDDLLISKIINGKLDSEGELHIRNLEKQYKDEVLEFCERIGPSDKEIFAQSYHRLVHSPLLPEILSREKNYAAIVANMVKRMDNDINSLIATQQSEMDAKLKELDVSATPEDINRLITNQCNKRELIRKRYESELDAIRGHQKNEHRNWITSQVTETITNSPVQTPIGNKSSMFVTQTPSMEESFTIHLGSQLKHMHNIRILSASVTDLCSPIYNTDESLGGLNIALGLYSSSLCGIVVLTPSGSLQANPEIIKNANMSTEFHFDQIDLQIEKINEDLTKSNDNKIAKLRPGDFFITKHSNLSQSHIIFHLISDEPYQSPTEINSRHPVILGLRNVLKVASKHDISCITIPALIREEMSEEMTVSWCMRRAELIFKCAKGFMIESSSWGGTELSTLQLLLPKDISENLFLTLSSMLPHVFRVANAKIFEEANLEN